jgi:hypothetical protein
MRWRELDHRPIGITIIAILIVFGAIAFLVSGLFLIGSIFEISIIWLALGIGYLVMAYGLWKGKGWAWAAVVMLSIIGIIMSVVSIVAGNIGGIIGLAINGIYLWYIMRSTTRAYFGKVKL